MQKYIIEIKNRVFLIFFSYIFTVIICYFYKETLLFLSIKPSISSINKSVFYFISTNLTEIFTTYIQLSCFVSAQLSIFFILYHILFFLAPGLYDFEYKNIKSILLVILCSWLVGFMILNFLILPRTWEFFMSFQNTVNNQAINLYFEAKIIEYVNFYINIYFICVLSCQFFCVLYILLEILPDKIKFVKKFRKSSYLIFFIIATLITPPDVISQILIAMSFIMIYEIIIVTVILKNVYYKI
uniref:Sec-independent protein translocase component TatC n=1 Tax=Hemiaulus sinensis TaxID=1003062 RepID=UPI002027AF98|nr:Sec-independent protein translocase component TatC [Hemiaulus sinensis]QYB23188.1 Sec-independent protein translocase component TatC [Hemiaulus sinensis]